MFKLRKYHDEKVQSLTYKGDDKEFSVGIIYPGTYEFGSIKKEINTVTAGRIKVWTETNHQWQEYSEGKKFTIPANTNFKFQCDEVSAYLCYYE